MHLKKEAVLVLLDIRSVHNVGAIFRTADGAGVRHVYFVGTTPTPIDRFGRKRKDFEKTALGAEKTVSWSHEKDPIVLIKKLRQEGYKIVSVEQDSRAVDFRKYVGGEKIAYIFGNEVGGISREVLDKSDEIIEIPMHGKKESLNVSVAVGIVLYGMFK